MRLVRLKLLILSYMKVGVTRSSRMAGRDWLWRLAWWPPVDTVVGKMDGCCSRWLPDSFEREQLVVGRRQALGRRTRQCSPAWALIVGHSFGLGSSVGRMAMVVGTMTECVQTWGLMRSHRLGCKLVDRMVVSYRPSCRSSLLPMRLMLGCRVRHKVIAVEVLVVVLDDRKIEQFDDRRLELPVEEVIRKCHPKILLDSIVDDNEWCCLVPFGRFPCTSSR